jgi:hypothetical protein
VLFPSSAWPGIAGGTVTVAFRRWKRPSVKAGGTLQSRAGLLAIDAVDVIDEGDVTDEDARAAGHSGVAEVLASLPSEGTLYRVRFHRLGDDPRIALRASADLDDAELARLRTALGRRPWARPTLRAIAHHPAVVSTELAAAQGVDRPLFKRRVRRLKALGLTESLEVGYRLSPRGEAVLAALDAG